MDVFKLLIQDHEKVKGLFEKLQNTSDNAKATREKLFGQVKQELTLHTEVEERFFYPALREKSETRAKVLEALEEHRLVDQLLRELDEMEKADEQFTARCMVMIENVLHHVKEEEEDLFPAAKKVLRDEESKSLAKKIEQFKRSKS